MIKKIYNAIKKIYNAIKNYGLKSCVKIFIKRLKLYVFLFLQNKDVNTVVDVIFINGCDYSLPHPSRYRVNHQIEELEKAGYTCRSVFYKNLQKREANYGSIFIVFRCPYMQEVEDFINFAHGLNKKVYFDIDDLVIDVSYTNLIPYVQSLSEEDKKLYDENVLSMKKTMLLCDGVITTTRTLARELYNYVDTVFINRNVASDEMIRLSQKAIKEKGNQHVWLGYFSGSITHNSDLEMITPVLCRLLEKYSLVKILIVGEINLPNDLIKYQNRISVKEFVNWKKLPKLLSQVDINIVPIVKNVFNEAKSENKWTEAALVKVPTVASDCGAFSEMIIDNNNGMLCKDNEEWFTKLEELILNEKKRKEIGENAFTYVIENCSTSQKKNTLIKMIKSENKQRLIFILPGESMSGGIMVAIRHAIILRENNYDVYFMCKNPNKQWIRFGNHIFPLLDYDRVQINAVFDKVVATMWTTVEMAKNISKCSKRYYLVQNFEPDFYPKNTIAYEKALETYTQENDFQYITISKWCENWLKNQYKKAVTYAPNGIDCSQFKFKKRSMQGKIRILVEGDSNAKHKNVDESFEIVNQMDHDKFEVWYLSYGGQPKEWYKCDKVFIRIPYDKVNQIYEQCDILVKSSLLESFSYPPLEMMATGGFVVVASNQGNIEYLIDGYNCLLYNVGDVNMAIRKIEEICDNKILREKLENGAKKTVQERNWREVHNQILALYN